ncbi:MAG: hypothetical protein Q7S33_02715 [Nanoarchaeota archaeon]|nr:hypothetical protein [Nanoarchaeota archaeon]
MISLKKLGVFFVFSLLFLLVFVSAENLPNQSSVSNDVNNIQNAVNDIPITETGEIDTTKLVDYQSKLEKNIAAINLWLENNASWLKIVFGMVPEISWLFFINFLIMITFLNILVLNGHSLFVFLSKSAAMIAGLAVFVILLVLKVFFNIALIIRNALNKWWMLLIGIILLIVINYFFDYFFKYRRKQEENAAKEKEQTNRTALDKFVKNSFGK